MALSLLSMGIASATSINLSELSLEKKVGQMVMVRGNPFQQAYADLAVGGVFLDRETEESAYTDAISAHKDAAAISLLVATDLEGYWNPFPFFSSPEFGEVTSDDAAYALGKAHGEQLRTLGFTIDFSPVTEVRNEVWVGRSFVGSSDEVKGYIHEYIRGLNTEGIIATAKHYPGGSMLRDPHKYFVHATISEEDLAYFAFAVEAGSGAVMVGHPIVTGALDSGGKQASVSPAVVGRLRQNFTGLIISDDINMLGLRLSYLFRREQLYVDLVQAGVDVILDSAPGRTSPRKVKRGIRAIVEAVERGEISQERIDASVQRILTAKGYTVVH